MIVNLLGSEYKLLGENSNIPTGAIVRKPFEKGFKYFNVEAFNEQTVKFYLTPVDDKLRNEMAIFLSKDQMIIQGFEILE